jgi:NADH:ubiquinone oxidoreductase subunit C
MADLFKQIIPGLQGVLVASYEDLVEPQEVTHVVTSRDALEVVATFTKLSSALSYSIAVDAFAVDRLSDEYRFTVTYILQSLQYNNSVRLETKVKDGHALVSLQGIYPAFN